jgi:hypothetical protein
MEFTFYTPNKITSTGAMHLYNFSITASTVTSADLSPLIDKNRFNTFTFSNSTYAYSVVFASMTNDVVSCISLQNINFKNFTLYVNSTAVTPISHITSTSDWNANTETNLIINFATVTASNVSLKISSTTSGDPYIGQFIIANQVYELPRNPVFSSYKPMLTGARDKKEMADGGFVTINTGEKFAADIALKWVPQSVQSALYSMWQSMTAYNFAPFATNTGWDGDIFECNWIDDFGFKEMVTNARNNPYYAGTIKLRETSS